MAETGVQVNIDLVKAAEDVVSAAAAVVEGAERSCVIEVDNQLPIRLIFDSSDHDHGGFGTLPKGVIEPMSVDVFSSRSSGVLTGTEGHVFYQFNDRKLFVHWDNPFVGSNSSDGHVEPDDPRFRVIAITGNGNHGAHMRFIIADVAPSPQELVRQQHIFYRATDGGNIHHVFFDAPANKLFHDVWNQVVGAPPAPDDSATMVTN
jgi:hypothetical protein